jgi:hypothetical protein
MIDIALLVAIVALIFAHIRLRDRIEVLETVVDRLDRESGKAAKTLN